ncbi:MAG TPA: hypothetical protein VKA73_01780 [Rubrobacter sp.]|nr:hypothetical protein [Rubrobacter sp.]
MVDGALNWFLGLGIAQKVFAVLFGGLVIFSTAYLISSAGFWLLGYGDEASDPPSEAASSPAPEASTPVAASETLDDMNMKITGVAWRGEIVVVEGEWRGDISSVHCDLLEGENGARVTDWWDRSVAASMSWQTRGFKQEFVEATGGRVEVPADPEASYLATCSANFEDGWQISDTAVVERSPG